MEKHIRTYNYTESFRIWRKIEVLGYLLTWITVPLHFYYVMIHLEGRRDGIPLWFWVITLCFWYSGWFLSGFAKFKKHDHTPVSIFFTVLGLVGPLLIYYIKNL